MTISWLSALDNEGRFTLSVSQRRHSVRHLAAHPFFTLSVAVAGLEPLLLRVGGCTGARVGDKASRLGVPLCRPGWRPLPRAGACHPTNDRIACCSSNGAA